MALVKWDSKLIDLFSLKQMIKGLLLNVPHREHVVIDTKCSHPSSVYPRENYNILPSLAKRELKCGDQLKKYNNYGIHNISMCPKNWYFSLDHAVKEEKLKISIYTRHLLTEWGWFQEYLNKNYETH